MPAATIEKQYADRQVGAYRATLIQAYTELEIAAHEEEKTTGLFKDKIIGEHPYFLALHTREGPGRSSTPCWSRSASTPRSRNGSPTSR